MAKSQNSIIIGSAVLCDNIKVQESGKIDCYGVFTSIIAYAYPSDRSWFLVFTLYNLPLGTSSIAVSIKRKGSRSKTSLKTIDVPVGPHPIGQIITGKVSFTFLKDGLYYIDLMSLETRATIRVPFKVYTEKWPEFNSKEIQFLQSTDRIPNAVRASIHCAECSHAYIFEEAVIPGHEYAGGVEPFPVSGKLECQTCGNNIDLLDIQGRMRASIKKSLQQTMEGR